MIEMKEKGYVSVICEYNPFHFGHLYQIQQLKKRFSGVVCIMSGNIVQRGSIAVADKYIRANAALQNGANLVLELPVPWCCSSAKDFALAGAHIADNIGTSHLAFGAEDELGDLNRIYSLMCDPAFQQNLKALVAESRNISYPQALKKLVGEELGNSFSAIIEKPNNILAIEYLSAIADKNIQPVVIKRNFEFASSSSIRSIENCGDLLNALPEKSRAVFENELSGDFPRDIKNLDSFFIGILRQMTYKPVPEGIYSAPEDLIKKILSTSLRTSTVSELVNSVTDKVYTSARVRRAVMALVFGIKAQQVHRMPSYTCVLAADETGREILRNAKKQSNIDIITKPSHAVEAGETTKEQFLFSKYCEDIIALSAPKCAPVDIGKTPKIV